MKKTFKMMFMASALLASALFAACGGKDDPDPEPQTDGTPHYALYLDGYDEPIANGDTVEYYMSQNASQPTLFFFIENLTSSTLTSRVSVKQLSGGYTFQVCYAGQCREVQTVPFPLQAGYNPQTDPNANMYVELMEPVAGGPDALFSISVGEADGLAHATTIYGRFINDLDE